MAKKSKSEEWFVGIFSTLLLFMADGFLLKTFGAHSLITLIGCFVTFYYWGKANFGGNY